MKAIFQREFKSYFTSITGYAFAAFLLLIIGIYTMSVCLVGYYPNYEYVLGNTAFIFLLIVPIVTMKTFAEERKQKTDQLLYALSLGMPRIVIGKYLALLAVFAVPLIPASLYPLILMQYGSLSLRVISTAMLGFLLLGASLLALGMFISSLTESQPLAVCGYALTLKFSEAAEAVDGTEEINFVSAATENIAKVSWTYDGEAYSLIRNDEGTWVRPDDKDFAVEQDTVSSMVAAAANIGASMRITDVTDYSQYGLDEPQSRIILEYAAEGDSDAADDTEGNAGLKKVLKNHTLVG